MILSSRRGMVIIRPLDTNGGTMVSSLNIWQAPARRVEHLARLHSLLRQLPLASGKNVLSVGCGVFPASLTIRTTLPGWTLYGLDLDGDALRRARQRDPGLHLI